MGCLILTTSPWSILTWITLVYMYIFCKPSIYFGCAHTCLSMVKYAILLIKFSLLTMNKIYGMCTKDIECFQNWLSVFKNIWMCSKIFECVQKYLIVFKNIRICSKWIARVLWLMRRDTSRDHWIRPSMYYRLISEYGNMSCGVFKRGVQN